MSTSRLILGGGSFGGIGSAPAFFGRGEREPEARAVMDAAWDAGITMFDTADAYGGGRSEAFIGRWLADRGPEVRRRLRITSKVFHSVQGDPADTGLARARILRQVDGSLARLGVERLDLYLTHEPDPATPIDETLEALDTLVRAGKVRAVGASNVTVSDLAAAEAARAPGGARVECVQNGYNLLLRDDDSGVLAWCAARGVGYVAFSPLAGGWLTGKYRPDTAFPPDSRMTLRPEPYRHLQRPATFAALAVLADEAGARGVAMGTLALAWLLHQPHVTAVVIGPRRAAHVADALAALDVALTDADCARIGGLFAAPA
ncbi:MAG: aldo/keto reductase [Vicinamibacterales bacterium]